MGGTGRERHGIGIRMESGLAPAQPVALWTQLHVSYMSVTAAPSRLLVDLHHRFDGRAAHGAVHAPLARVDLCARRAEALVEARHERVRAGAVHADHASLGDELGLAVLEQQCEPLVLLHLWV